MKNKIRRSSGILMPVSALPSRHGIGTLGAEAYKFIDFLSESSQSYWQLLPLGPTGFGDSPYSSFSSFAGNPYFIDLDILEKEGILTKNEIKKADLILNDEKCDYGTLYLTRFDLLRKGYERAWNMLEKEISQFRLDNASWIENYALYMALKSHFSMKCWTQWDDEGAKARQTETLEKYRCELKCDIEFYIFIQYLFYKQWNELRTYAAEKGIRFIGDIPIYVPLDSADVWSEQQFFMLDEKYLPIEVAGVPPDAFSEDGQLWGNPVYNWDAMINDGYGWWIRRIGSAAKMYDVIRLDHFRGFESYWSVPYGEKTAVNGKWVKGPGYPFIKVITEWFSDISFIAEDLGVITDEVSELLEKSAFPGMKVLEFAFDSKGGSDYLPHNCIDNSVCYIGTHDNETVSGWLTSSKKKDVEFAEKYCSITKEEGWQFGLIRSGMSTRSLLFIVQMQDLLCLPADCRMNTPGTSLGNWQWRMKKGAITKKLTKKLSEYTKRYGRAALSEDVSEKEATDGTSSDSLIR